MQRKPNPKLQNVESKLNHETKAMLEKKRTKFDKEKERGKDAMTMGGNLLGVHTRALPFWKQQS